MASVPRATNGTTQNSQTEEVSENIPTKDVSYEQLETDIGINPQVLNFLKNLLETYLAKRNDRKNKEPIPIVKQLYTALQFLKSGKHSPTESAGDISQPSVSRYITNLIDCLLEVAPQFIKFPNTEEAASTQEQFYDLGKQEYDAGFPNVLGIIDCTHVLLQAPPNHPELYVDRHSQHSINVQIVCGPDLQIYNVLAAFPGGSEDSYVWHNSNLRRALAETKLDNTWLIGDLEYPQEPWLMTPIAYPKSPPEELYNKAHSVTWNCIKQCTAALKSRFRCLQSILNYAPEKVCAIITTCCVLHNICLRFGDTIETEPEFNEPQDADIKQKIVEDTMEEGVTARDALIKSNFLC